MAMLTVCSATSSWSSLSQGLPRLVKCNAFSKRFLKAHATKSLYPNFVKSAEQSVSVDFVNRSSCSNESDHLKCKYSDMWSSSTRTMYEQHPPGRVELKFVDTSSLLTPDEGLVDFTNPSTENESILSAPIEPESISATDLTPGNPTSVSDSLDMDSDKLSSVKTSIEDFFDGVSKSFSASVDKGEYTVKTSLDTIASSITTVVKSATEAVDNTVGGLFSTVDQVGQYGGSKTTNLSSDFKEATSKGIVFAIDVLRRSIVVVEDSLSNGASLAVSSYQSAKDFLPPDISDALNLSEKRFVELLGPAKTAFQQVLREREGIPDLRRAARFRYASVSLPEVDGAVWKLVKSGRDLNDTLTAAVIRNLKIVQDFPFAGTALVLDLDDSDDEKLMFAYQETAEEYSLWNLAAYRVCMTEKSESVELLGSNLIPPDQLPLQFRNNVFCQYRLLDLGGGNVCLVVGSDYPPMDDDDSPPRDRPPRDDETYGQRSAMHFLVIRFHYFFSRRNNTISVDILASHIFEYDFSCYTVIAEMVGCFLIAKPTLESECHPWTRE
ncbi:hypothetical protein C1H46_034246 [Malus baccata]|uniref:Uncharacterized protein n=1 Tax=Malus baccata TaxID=106549 RepID=A0A540L1N4_MALBA|nr:hypothetical protein C1H46_034246 [Malus baccata]